MIAWTNSREPMLERRTLFWLGAYALYTLGHFAFVARPGPAMAARGAAKAVTLPEALELIFVHVLPDEREAVVGFAGEGGGELWLIDWTRRGEWLDGRVSLAELSRGRMPAQNQPNDVRRLSEGGLAMMIGDAERGYEWVRWDPPAEPVREPLPAGTSWVTRAGRPVTTAELDAQLAADPKTKYWRAWPGPAGVVGDIAFTRINASTDPEYRDYIRDDDLLIFAADTGELIEHWDTVPIRWSYAASRVQGVVYTTDRATALDVLLCDEDGCREPRAHRPYLGAGEGSIHELDLSPELERAVLCSTEGELLLFAWAPERMDGTQFLAKTALAEGCGRVILVDESRVLVQQAPRWVLVEFEARGGWL